MTQREGLLAKLKAKLDANDQILETQRIQQVEFAEELHKLWVEL